ncbi:MAG: hypothetical protein V1824_01430 [archaeon]
MVKFVVEENFKSYLENINDLKLKQLLLILYKYDKEIATKYAGVVFNKLETHLQSIKEIEQLESLDKKSISKFKKIKQSLYQDLEQILSEFKIHLKIIIKNKIRADQKLKKINRDNKAAYEEDLRKEIKQHYGRLHPELKL